MVVPWPRYLLGAGIPFRSHPGSRAGSRHRKGHRDSVGWDHAMGPGGDKSDPASHTSPFLFGALPACHCRSGPLILALGTPDARDQHHSPAPSPPTPRPPTPRPPMMGTPCEHQWGWAVSDPLLAQPHMCPSVLGQPHSPMPWGSIPLPASLCGSISLPASLCPHPCGGASLCPHPSARASRCLGSAPASTYLGCRRPLGLQPREHLPERNH